MGQLRAHRVVPHVAEYAPNPKWPSFLTEQERSGEGFQISQRKRKLVEKVFGWSKSDRPMRQTKFRGLPKVGWMVQLLATAHNLRRMQTLLQTVYDHGRGVSKRPEECRHETKKHLNGPKKSSTKPLAAPNRPKPRRFSAACLSVP